MNAARAAVLLREIADIDAQRADLDHRRAQLGRELAEAFVEEPAEERPKRRRVQRVDESGRRVSVGVYDSEEEANAIASGVARKLAEGHANDGVTLAAWGKIALDRRERHGLRGVERERSRWAHHVAADELAELPVRQLERADVQRWTDRILSRRAAGPRGGKTIARQTAANALTLLRAVLEDACAHGVAKTNAAAAVKLPRARGRTSKAWTYLTPEEQARLLEAVPAFARPTVRFAISTGLRQGEQWALRLEDVHLDAPTPHVIVRYGGAPDLPTKNGEIRRVDLLPEAVRAVREQLERLREERRLERERAARKGTMPRDMNPHRILFPSRLRDYRSIGEPPGWHAWTRAAGLGRRVRWHDLRHTCASSLVAGWWGRAWTLVEVRGLLGTHPNDGIVHCDDQAEPDGSECLYHRRQSDRIERGRALSAVVAHGEPQWLRRATLWAALGPGGQVAELVATESAHKLVELRALLASAVDAIDARLRELDGRSTAGSPSLYVKPDEGT